MALQRDRPSTIDPRDYHVHDKFYYGSLIFTCVFMMIAFCLGVGSLIKQSTCHRIDRPTNQIVVVAFADACIAVAFVALYFVLGTMSETVKTSNFSSNPLELIGFYQVPALIAAVFMIVAVGLFAKSSTIVTHLKGHSCAREEDRKTVQNLDISAAVFCGVSVASLCILIFRPWRGS